MKISNFLFVAILLFLFVSACGDDDSDSQGNVDCTSSIAVNSAIADEIDAIGVAANAYGLDQSTANCNALQQAYQGYVNALTDLQDCANDAGVGAEFAESLIEAQNNVNNLNC